MEDPTVEPGEGGEYAAGEYGGEEQQYSAEGVEYAQEGDYAVVFGTTKRLVEAFEAVGPNS